jgi:hypothetical protein
MMLVEGVEAFGEGEQDEELMHGGKSRGGGVLSVPLCQDRGRNGGGSGG